MGKAGIKVNIEGFEFEVTDNPSSEDLDFLTQKINEELAADSFTIFVRKEGKIVAGCNGSMILWDHVILLIFKLR